MTLLEVVVRALADMVVSLELSSEDMVPAEFAAQIFGDLAGVFDSLDAEQRRQLAVMIDGYVETVSDAERRDALAGFSESMGLTED